jgi:hypothetical protein
VISKLFSKKKIELESGYTFIKTTAWEINLQIHIISFDPTIVLILTALIAHPHRCPHPHLVAENLSTSSAAAVCSPQNTQPKSAAGKIVF